MQRPYSLDLREQPLEGVSLPVEILAHIFTHLDLPSVRAVRLASKTFYSATQSRQFWYHHINKLVETRHVSVPEEKLDDYTLGELEQWALRRARALGVFFDSQKPRFRERIVDVEPDGLCGLEVHNFTLIPGGRWLLVSRHCSAALYFVDLDSLNPRPRLLFDPEQITGEIRKLKGIEFAIWVSRGTPRLSFRLAFLVETEDTSRTYTSQIDLAGHGVDVTLAVSNVAVLRNFNLELSTLVFALNDRYLAQVWNDRMDEMRFGVYDYHQALGHPDHPIDHGSDDVCAAEWPTRMEFICDDILAAHCVIRCTLYIFAVEPSTPLRLLHCIPVGSPNCWNFDPWSTPRWTPGATIITLIREGPLEAQGIVISHDRSCPPRTVTLRGIDKRRDYLLGTRVLVAREKPHKVFSYDWDFNSPDSRPVTLTFQIRKRLTTNLLMFDEDIGRFIGYPHQRHLVIYDII